MSLTLTSRSVAVVVAGTDNYVQKSEATEANSSIIVTYLITSYYTLNLQSEFFFFLYNAIDIVSLFSCTALVLKMTSG